MSTFGKKSTLAGSIGFETLISHPAPIKRRSSTGALLRRNVQLPWYINILVDLAVFVVLLYLLLASIGYLAIEQGRGNRIPFAISGESMQPSIQQPIRLSWLREGLSFGALVLIDRLAERKVGRIALLRKPDGSLTIKRIAKERLRNKTRELWFTADNSGVTGEASGFGDYDWLPVSSVIGVVDEIVTARTIVWSLTNSGRRLYKETLSSPIVERRSGFWTMYQLPGKFFVTRKNAAGYSLNGSIAFLESKNSLLFWSDRSRSSILRLEFSTGKISVPSKIERMDWEENWLKGGRAKVRSSRQDRGMLYLHGWWHSLNPYIGKKVNIRFSDGSLVPADVTHTETYDPVSQHPCAILRFRQCGPQGYPIEIMVYRGARRFSSPFFLMYTYYNEKDTNYLFSSGFIGFSQCQLPFKERKREKCKSPPRPKSN